LVYPGCIEGKSLRSLGGCVHYKSECILLAFEKCPTRLCFRDSRNLTGCAIAILATKGGSFQRTEGNNKANALGYDFLAAEITIACRLHCIFEIRCFV
jgi:hypothetical protein